MERGNSCIAMLVLVLGGCAAAARPAPTAPVVNAVANARPRGVLGLGTKPDKRFVYVVKADGVYAIAHAADAEGRPVFSRKSIKVASIEPALDPGDQRVVDRDGDLVPAPGRDAPRGADAARRLVVLVKDPARVAQLDVAPRSKEEFLALDDRTLVEYACAWLRYRDVAGASLSGAERDVMLASLAFTVIADDGFSELLALRSDDLPAMGASLRKMSLDRHAEVIDEASSLARAGKQSESANLDMLWKQLKDDPVPRLAAYIRAHADEIDWARMRR